MFKQKNGQRYPTPLIATDLVIEYKGTEKEGIVLIERKYEPLGLALPGGMAEIGISFGQNAQKEAKEETGLDVIIEDETKPLLVLSNPDRDPRDHIASISYIAKGTGILKPHPKEDAKNAAIYTNKELEVLVNKENQKFAFPDHVKILKEYLNQRGAYHG